MKNALVFLMCVLAFTSIAFSQTDMAVLMCVADATAMQESETTIMTKLQDMGMVVDPMTAGDVVGDDAINYDLVFVHEAIGSGSVADKFKTVPTPLVSTEFYIADDMALVGPTSGVDFGQLNSNPIIDYLLVENPDHPITQGFEGEIFVYNQPGNMGFGVPGGDGLPLLTYPNNPDMSMLFVFDEGVEDIGGDEVPARRVFFFTFNGQESNMTDDAWVLFERSVKWAVGIEDTSGTQVATQPITTPTTFRLAQNYPNPFNPITEINYVLALNSRVALNIYNTRGERVASLVNERQNAGQYSVTFDASTLPSGIYLYTLQADDQVVTKKMVLAR